MTTVISNDVQNPPQVTRRIRKDPDPPPAIPEGAPRTGYSAGTPRLREDDRAQPALQLHITGQTGSHITAGPPTIYLCGAPVRLLLGAIAAGDGPDGPGVCPICAELDHPGRLPARTGARPAAAPMGHDAIPA